MHTKNTIICFHDSTRREKVTEMKMGPTPDVDDVELRRRSSSLTHKKFKLPKKVFNNYNNNSVIPPSVPRKLRSAIAKRSCNLGSVPLLERKRIKHSVNNVERKDCLNFTKLRMNRSAEKSPRLAPSLPISKEEEEVAHTLFALAGMISLNGESSEGETADLARNKRDFPTSSSQDPVTLKGELETASHLTSSDAISAVIAADSSAGDSLLARSSIKSPPLSWHQVPESRQLNTNLEISVPPLHLQPIPPLLRPCNERQLANSAGYSQILVEPRWQRRSNETMQEKTLLSEPQSHTSNGGIDVAASKEREQAIAERRDNGLISRSVQGSGVDRLPLQSFPFGLNTAPSSSRPFPCGDSVSSDKVSGSTNGSRKAWKRCITHVHISRMIQVLQMSEGKDSVPLDGSHFRQSQCASVNPDRNEQNRSQTTNHMFNSTAYQNNWDTGSRVSMTLEHLDDKKDGPSSSRCYGSKQSFDFLSLSTGVGPETNVGVNRLGNHFDGKGPLLHVQSVAQVSASLPCSIPQNRFPTNGYQDQVSLASMALPQVNMQIPQYFPNGLGTAQMLGTLRSTEQQQSKTPSQQQIWTAQLAAQFRPGPLLSSHMTHWQNRTQDPRMSTDHMQSQRSSPRPSLEMIGAKYVNISQQQQQLIGRCPPLQFSSTKPQNGLLPSACEDKGGRCRPDDILPLQLLCNETL